MATKTMTRPKAGTKVKTAAKPKAAVKPKAAARAKTSARVKPAAKPRTSAATKAKTGAKARTATKAKAVSRPKAGAKVKASAKAVTSRTAHASTKSHATTRSQAPVKAQAPIRAQASVGMHNPARSPLAGPARLEPIPAQTIGNPEYYREKMNILLEEWSTEVHRLRAKAQTLRDMDARIRALARVEELQSGYYDAFRQFSEKKIDNSMKLEQLRATFRDASERARRAVESLTVHAY